MKPTTRLSSAVFQLTPTRTRCDLIIISNNEKEKIASGLLDPFLSHLKTAQDQNAKGGYSIFLEPESNDNAAWFTKTTLQRFVRFVSTPEILERIYTIETQIIQIDEAISIQSSNDNGHSNAEYHQEKPVGSFEGNESKAVSKEEKAIILYEPGSQPSEADGLLRQDGNSKVQLLKVFEIRKTALLKEQGMAFARAVAAGFDIDHMAPLLAFAKCFGASRLMEACSRFRELWKRKYENGQWTAIEAAEALSTRSDFSSANSSGAMPSFVPNKNNESNHDLVLANNRNLDAYINADGKPPADCSVPNGHGQFPHLMFPPWPVHTPPGAPPFVQAYPVQGIPYCQTYTGNGPFHQPPHSPMEQSAQKVQQIDGRDSNGIRSKDNKEVPHSQEAQKEAKRSVKNQSGMIVIRNINYIDSKVKKYDGECHESSEDSDTDLENEEFEGADLDVIQNKHSGRHGSRLKSKDESNFNDEVADSRIENDDKHWLAFQNLLLKQAAESANGSYENMFVKEKDVKINGRANYVSHDPLALGGRDTGEMQDTRMNGIYKVSGSMLCKPRGFSDEFLLSREKTDFRGNRSNFGKSSELLAVDGFGCAIEKMDRESSSGIAHEAFMVPFRSMSIDQEGVRERTVIDFDPAIPSKHKKSGSNSRGTRNQVNYEADDLNLMPERATEKRLGGYDPALDFKMQVCLEGSTSEEKRKKGVADVKRGIKKSDKDRRSKVTTGYLNKQRTGGPIRKEKLSTINPVEDARARAAQLRSFKADLQKMKKEKEEAELKRLEALKLERQKRIASRGSSTYTKLSVPSPQTKKLPTKLPPIANRGSKFSDSEPGSSSPLQRSKVRISVGSSESQKVFKASKGSEPCPLAVQRVSRSASSLPEPKRGSNGVTLDSKVSMARIRRLSEPKTNCSTPASSIKALSAEAVSKRKTFVGPERNKIAAIKKLYRSNAPTPSGVNIKNEETPMNMGLDNSVLKGTLQLNGVKSSAFSENAEIKVNDCSQARESDIIENNPIVEKTIVILECEKPSIHTAHSSEGKMSLRDKMLDDHNKGEKSDIISEVTAVHAPTLPVDGVDTTSLPNRPRKQWDPNPVNNKEKDPLKFADAIPAKKPYQAPYARVPPIEAPSSRNTDNNLAPSRTSEMTSRVQKAAKPCVPDVKTLRLDKKQDSTQVKESSKGFRRLLKFGKKNHSSASVESGAASVDGFDEGAHGRNGAAPKEVDTLKNLISQEEISTAGNSSQKSSRHFSLLPFWSRSSDKKLAS